MHFVSIYFVSFRFVSISFRILQVPYLHSPKAKEVWKIIVKKHQNKFWKETCKEDKKIKKTLKYLQLQENITKPHNIWHSVKNSEIDVKAEEIKAKIATQTYMVHCQKSKFVKKAAATCPLCGTEDEDLWSLHTCLYKI
jgi:hypothetical protein